MNGPKRPLFTTSPLPHVGQRSVWRFERSCTSWMIAGRSTADSACANGPQNSPSTSRHARSPSSTLSSSFSIWAVNPTSNTAGILPLLRLVALVVQHAVAVEQHPRPGRPEQEPAEIEVDRRGLVLRGGHLRRHEAAPDELVQLEEVGCGLLLQALGAAGHIGGPDGLVLVLHPR